MPIVNAVDELMPIEEDLNEAIRSGEVALMSTPGPAAGSAQKHSATTGGQPHGRSTEGQSTDGLRSVASMADTAGGAAGWRISFEALSWLLWTAFTIWWIVDRFTYPSMRP